MAVNEVIYNGETLISLKEDTVTPETLAEGATAHSADGRMITGTMKSGGSSVQTDWNQTDETAPDFLKNKPFGDGYIVVLEEQEIAFDSEMGGHIAFPIARIEDGDTLIIVYEGNSYECIAALNEGIGGICFGNFAFLGADDNTGEPFFGAYMLGMLMFLFEDEATHTMSLSRVGINKLRSEYVETYSEFYTFDFDKYIYTDISCVNKATQTDILTAAKKGHIRLVHKIADFELSVSTVLYAPIMEQSDFFVLAYNLAGSEIVEYRTAEYTPET